MTTKTFDSMGLTPRILTGIKKINYISPMPVQAEVIPLVLQGKDVLASAQTGSGKTAAFTIPVFDILARDPLARCLVVAPTRELAQQILKVFNELAYNSDICTSLIVGGKFMQDQLKKLKKNPRFIVGTPGRLNDHLKRKSLVLDNFKYVVWDEMDRMLDLGFIHQIEHIIAHLPKERQTLMFSATFPKRVLTLAKEYLTNPSTVIIENLNSIPKNIEQKTINTEGAKKPKELEELLKTLKGQVIVFVKTQKTADMIKTQLVKKEHKALSLHGGLKQRKREKIVALFKEKEADILVATDIAARGLDIPKISYVINYELPQSPEEYIHRIGRTGRVKEKGVAISLVGKADRKTWKRIEDFLKGNEAAPTEVELQREKQILQTNRAAGPFPVKTENKISFKTSFKAAAQHASKKENKKAAQPKSHKTEVKKKFGFSTVSALKREKQKPQSDKQSYKKPQSATQPEQKKKEPATPFKRVYVGKNKEKSKKEFKKYGNGPAKYWGKVQASKNKNHDSKKNRRRK